MSLGEEEAARRLAALKARKTGADKKVLAIDPGTKSTGIAVFNNGQIEFVDVIRNVPGQYAKDRLPEMCQRVVKAMRVCLCFGKFTHVAIEWQHIREDDPRPNNLLELQTVVGAALAVERDPFTALVLPLPVQWKGSLQGDVFTRFAAQHFPLAVSQMTKRKVPEGEQHNGLDACALAAWAAIGRLPWMV